MYCRCVQRAKSGTTQELECRHSVGKDSRCVVLWVISTASGRARVASGNSGSDEQTQGGTGRKRGFGLPLNPKLGGRS